MTTSIAILDCEMGNRRSVEKAFLRVGADAKVTKDPEQILTADGAVIVGVGAFPEAMRRLEQGQMVKVLRERYALGRPIFGICLGLQIFFQRSEEHGGAEGLGFLKGTVQRLPANGRKVPHIGWNQVQWREGSRLRHRVKEEDSTFYHLHSFAAFDAAEPDEYLSVRRLPARPPTYAHLSLPLRAHRYMGFSFIPRSPRTKGCNCSRISLISAPNTTKQPFSTQKEGLGDLRLKPTS